MSMRALGARSMGDYLVDADPVPPFAENFIDFRASVARAMQRSDDRDETLEICGWCMCEIDTVPAPHKPDCPGIGKPRASSATSTSVRVLEKREPEAREADVGSPPAADRGVLPAAAVLRESRGPAGTELASRSSSASTASKRPGRPKLWTREKIVGALQAFHAAHGCAPATVQLGRNGMPTRAACIREFGSLAAALAAAGIERPAKSSGGAVADPGESGSARSINDQVKETADGPPADASPLPEQPHPEEPPDADVAEAERLADLVDPPAPPDLESVRKAALHAVNAIFDLLAEVERTCGR